MNFSNLTPHEIVLQPPAGAARITIPPNGTIARVSSTPGDEYLQPECLAAPVPIYAAPAWGAVEGLPSPCAHCHGTGVVAVLERDDETATSELQALRLAHLPAKAKACFALIYRECLECKGRTYIVSVLVLGHPEVAGRCDVVAPGTGPDDAPIRMSDGPRKGQIEAVTRLIAAPRRAS